MQQTLRFLPLLRPHQYAKNMFIFLPAFFAGRALDTEVLVTSFVAFAAFCFAASGVYIFNDIFDREEDRQHPVKQERPIAAGKVSIREAAWLAGGMAMVSLSIPLLLNTPSVAIIAFYLLLNVVYTTWFKKFALLDINIIALGFLLRLFAGSFAANIYLSKWIIIMTFLLALFLALAKRRDDYLLRQEGLDIRQNIDGYNLAFIDSGLSILAAVILVAYIMYTTSAESIAKFNTDYLYMTSVFVLLGLFRYLQLTLVMNKSGSPTRILLQDHFVQITLSGWVLSFLYIIY